ncbi:MAG: phosphate ABC transporter permease PstA [Candidatus Auribacter fodinae]|jgi:phosphate transport system permease protein|uniref:Phosphate transport system permease protein PstA n=1 Tax=Candidatus Auribacter fodinae TaxID=2093366 RepID=A0A3A4QY75_9BACT|nr:MAG: phosphate ABC transporter permease PstA [Candidatus Auribacter fodinae]
MKAKSLYQRRLVNFIMLSITAGCALFSFLVLVMLIIALCKNGYPALTKTFFTALPAPPGVDEGGVSNALQGSIKMILFSALIGVPTGILAGLYIGELARNTRKADFVLNACGILSGTPTIVTGLFVYTLIVIPSGHFSGFAGITALTLIIIPVTARITAEILVQSSTAMREAAFALGASQWNVTFFVLLRAVRSGLASAILLTIARISGETAPLLFTALNNNYEADSLSQPTASITVTIFQYALSPFAERNDIAWGAALLLTLFILAVTLIARYTGKPQYLSRPLR